MSAALVQLKSREATWRPLHDPIVIGKDILELLSSSMYVEPLTIYREYVQNAADAIDEARATGLLGPDDQGAVEITLIPESRAVRIRDNGTGIPARDFLDRLASFGGSKKRGTEARGFRGVGRLAGIGSCQELVFRSRARGERYTSELRWDCKALKGLLRSADNTRDLTGTVAEVVTSRVVNDGSYPERFFEVELRGVIRHRNDQLLSPVAIGEYLEQVAPIPLREDFPHARVITEHIAKHVSLSDLQITITGRPDALRRPHTASLRLGPEECDSYTDLDLVDIPGLDGGTAAVGWVAHHGYTGSLPASCNVRGLRVRAGNIQVGDERLLEELFPEVRFNSWAVGEIHVIDRRITPNGRRDHFEQNAHYENLLTHLLPAARDIARRCRASSLQRKWSRDFDRGEQVVKEKLSVVNQGAVTKGTRKRFLQEIQLTLAGLESVAQRGFSDTPTATNMVSRLGQLRRSVAKVQIASPAESPAGGTRSGPQRKAFEQVIDLIYDCHPNQSAAKLLVDKILARLK